ATNTMQETEFNDLPHPLFANRIWKSGLTVTGFISYGSAGTPLVPSLDLSDVDYYFITVPPSSTLTVDLDVPAGVDYDVMLRSPSGTKLTGSANGPGLAEHVVYVTAPTFPAGVYIQVYSKDGSFSVSSPYTLTATFSRLPRGRRPHGVRPPRKLRDDARRLRRHAGLRPLAKQPAPAAASLSSVSLNPTSVVGGVDGGGLNNSQLGI